MERATLKAIMLIRTFRISRRVRLSKKGKTIRKALFVAHLNINNIQNKFEELKLLNDELKAHILIASETKIDCSYPDDQFSLQGYPWVSFIAKTESKEEVGSLLISLRIYPLRN